MKKTLPPISLYIHIPWCIKKCFYCDFTSYVTEHTIPEKKYIYHLLKDLETSAKLIKDRTIHSIFIGGGTPSLIQPHYIKKLLYSIKNIISISKHAEITIEINPKIKEISYIDNYQDAGINRISIGIQSFNSNHLKIIGRNHTSKESHKAIEMALKYNSINLNLDLIHGLPQQSLHHSLLDLQTAIQYSPHHISWYELTIEPNTVFAFKKPNLPSINNLWKIFKHGNVFLKKSGYIQYEISSYSKPEYQCQHNLNYWNYGDYIGIGCSAHSKITNHNGSITRIVKKKQIFHFTQGQYIEKLYYVNKQDRIIEYFINSLRLFSPISKKQFQNRTHINPTTIKNEIQEAMQQNYLTQTKTHWTTTRKGKLFLNNLLEIFVKNQ
ncbi:MAG: radical SAM family heme chaperone HemW [Buchnera aphidicola (Eriosoma harunire)]